MPQRMNNMADKITIQVHDWDSAGRYRIVREEQVSKEELVALKKQARNSARENLDWDVIDEQNKEWCSLNGTRFCHLLYYAELLNEHGDIWFAGIYMHGQAYIESDFERITNRQDIGYVGAFHRYGLCF